MDGGTALRFLRSTLASYASLLAKLAVAFAVRLVLARLLLPTTHGLYEYALRIVMVAAAVRDLGLPFHLMRDPRRPYGTVLAFVLAGPGIKTQRVPETVSLTDLMPTIVELAGFGYALAAALSATLGGLVNFAVSKYWAFRDPSPLEAKQVATFAMVCSGTAAWSRPASFLLTA